MTKIAVQNRSAGIVVYSIPDLGIRREYAAGEIKNIDPVEMIKLSYIPGGRKLISEYLLVKDTNVLDEIGLNVEPEYNLTQEEILNLIDNGDLIDWENTLNFAPEGVLDLIKKLSLSHGLRDYGKRELLLKITGFDLTKAENLLAPEPDEEKIEDKKPIRKTKSATILDKPVRKTKTTDLETIEEEAPAQPKRGRGRPRKNA